MNKVNQITIFFPGEEPRNYNLDAFEKDVVKMGRSRFHGDGATPNDIQIDGDATLVSRAHCTFQRNQQGNWFVTDDNSANGLIFHEHRVKTHELHDGDKIYIGENPEKRLIILYSVLSATVEKGAMKSFSLHGVSRCVIGRSKDCDIVISHPTVSRNHCVITLENGRYYISDNNSKNGVILNSALLQKKQALHQMDRISIADTSIVFCDGFLYVYELSGGVSVSAERLCRKVGKGSNEKYITNHVTLFIEPNEFVAIVGGSGAGKTTLLNCLSGITDFTSGEVRINGESIRDSGKSLRSLMGYVPQQDIVYDSLTLERMLFYSARLRMPRDTSAEEIQQKIEETLRVVELSEHKKTLISKLSGGQRKRASIAVELLASPKLFFLDEPSSGLDPGTEKNLMQMLKRLSASGKTVVMVTHTVQNIDLCDRLICMGKGGLLCYSGPPGDAPAFFGKERMTDIYDDLNENAEEMARKFARFTDETEREKELSRKSGEMKREKKGPRALFREFAIMTGRYAEIMANNPTRLLLLLLMPVILTLLVCVAFQADGNFYNRIAALYDVVFHKSMAIVRENFPFLVATDTMSLLFAFSCAAFWTGIFNSIQEVSKERAIYEREKFAGIAAFPYVLSKFALLSVLCLIQSVIMTAILTFMTSTTATVDGNVNSVTALAYAMSGDSVVLGSGMMWLETFLTTFLCVLSAMCLGLLISCLVSSNEMAMVLCPVCLMPQILFSGVVGTLSGITESLSQFISCKWSCLAFFISSGVNELYKSCSYDMGEWDFVSFSDDGGAGLLDAAYESTKEYLFGLNGILSAWVALSMMCVACIAMAVLILRFKRTQTR